MGVEFQILGHCNATLALIIDTLLCKHECDQVTVTIVSNIPVDDPVPYDFDESINLSIREIDSTEWDGKATNPVLGVVNTRTKEVVYSHFLHSHGIREEDYSTVVHPSAVIGRQTSLGAGIYIGRELSLRHIRQSGP